MARLWELLGIEKGLTAVMGSGGKTSLLYELAEELRGETRRLLVLGDGGRLCRDGLAQLGVESELAPAQLLYQNAVGVGLAAEHGTPVSAQELAPVYLRISQAERERNARLQQESTQK